MNRLREFREKAKLTQQELANRAGISRATIIDIENNSKADIKVSTLIALADALNSDPGTIFFSSKVKHAWLTGWNKKYN